jgi:hypothetical protein
MHASVYAAILPGKQIRLEGDRDFAGLACPQARRAIMGLREILTRNRDAEDSERRAASVGQRRRFRLRAARVKACTTHTKAQAHLRHHDVVKVSGSAVYNF